ncbi:DNA translocase FtsK 4TM domain-containing protein [Thermaurantiacus sp.]
MAWLARARARRVIPGLRGFLGGLLLLGGAVALGVVLVSHNPADPSLNTATARAPTNGLGRPGAFVSDLLLQGFGLASLALVVMLAARGVRRCLGWPVRKLASALVAGAGGLVFLASAGGLLRQAPASWLDATAGGLVGHLARAASVGLAEQMAADPLLVATLGGLGFGLAGLFLAVRAGDIRLRLPSLPRTRRRPRGVAPASSSRAEPLETRPAAANAPRAAPPAVVRPRMAEPSLRAERERQSSLMLGDQALLPPLALLKPPPPVAGSIDEAALTQNAHLLEAVLEDFGVRGSIVGISQGPVVTLYELEPAPGIKASRVIGLADDIARSMSAVSARVAVIPGRNVIGIELPNRRRELVVLSELIASDAFEHGRGALPLVLGKDIAGSPVVADLAPMPHLLIAGTTGSGKSVGLNAMILSLLYRLRPEDCRLILIDPKMLELSVYDGIPHLLAPVVTEPAKAIRALKWAVEQMEDRYRNMTHIGARSLAAYNERVREAIRKGESFNRRVQTGFDAEGNPEYEELTLHLEPLPLIVIVVDEMADLMMTAGKEVEFLVQRLAQKARAAGIHLIMATQRPSVDVITGVIKANLPTRISFQVTSKIDSRTILGEQGAEQLLGKGDMLYMPGANRIVRVHGPFVSDEEVEAVVRHWRAQGTPAYLDSVTEEPEGPDGFEAMPRASGAGGRQVAVAGDGDLLSQAIQVVAVSRKATISYLQRTLRVGYNSAARLIEQMEAMGLVSAPDHVGRREVLMDEAGNRV